MEFIALEILCWCYTHRFASVSFSFVFLAWPHIFNYGQLLSYTWIISAMLWCFGIQLSEFVILTCCISSLVFLDHIKHGPTIRKDVLHICLWQSFSSHLWLMRSCCMNDKLNDCMDVHFKNHTPKSTLNLNSFWELC